MFVCNTRVHPKTKFVHFFAWANTFCLESRGFAFVRYYDKRDAEDAIDRLNGYELDGR